MGTIFAIYKRSPEERYELGKHRQGYPYDLMPPEATLMEKVNRLQTLLGSLIGPPSTKQLADHYSEMNRLVNPGWGQMWSIMDTPDYSVFRMSRWTREQLADKLYRGSRNIDSMEVALKVADDLLRWCGDDEVTLNPEEEGDLKELGWPTRGYRDTGSIWEAMRDE